MKLAYAVFCDFARQGVGNKPDIFGVFANIDATELPIQVPYAFLCATLNDVPEPAPGIPSEFKVSLELIAPSGDVAYMLDGVMSMPVDAQKASMLQIFANLGQPILLEGGRYTSKLVVNGEHFDGPDLNVTVKRVEVP